MESKEPASQPPKVPDESRILLVVDTQFDFMLPSGKLYVRGAEKLIVPMFQFIAKNAARYRFAYFTQDIHSPTQYAGSEESKQFPLHCEAGRIGSMNVLPMAYKSGHLPFYTQQKTEFDMWEDGRGAVFNAFMDYYSTRDVFWDREARAASRNGSLIVDVMGVAADYCVMYAVRGLLQRGFKVNVLSDLTVGINRQWPQVADEEFGKFGDQLTSEAAGAIYV